MMQRKHHTLTYIDLPPRVEQENAPMLVMLHGYGSNEKDLISLAPALDPRLHIISVRAPHELDQGMFGWFRIEFTANGILVDRQAAIKTAELFFGFLNEIISMYRPAGNRVFLMGFSQGAVMNYLTALKSPELLYGVVALSGQLPEYRPPENPVAAALQELPFLVIHGLYDDVLPIEKGREAHRWLENNVNDVVYREYPMAHQISSEALDLVVSWLEEKVTRSLE